MLGEPHAISCYIRVWAHYSLQSGVLHNTSFILSPFIPSNSSVCPLLGSPTSECLIIPAILTQLMATSTVPKTPPQQCWPHNNQHAASIYNVRHCYSLHWSLTITLWSRSYHLHFIQEENKDQKSKGTSLKPNSLQRPQPGSMLILPVCSIPFITTWHWMLCLIIGCSPLECRLPEGKLHLIHHFLCQYLYLSGAQ